MRVRLFILCNLCPRATTVLFSFDIGKRSCFCNQKLASNCKNWWCNLIIQNRHTWYAKSDMSQNKKSELEKDIDCIYCAKYSWQNKGKLDRKVQFKVNEWVYTTRWCPLFSWRNKNYLFKEDNKWIRTAFDFNENTKERKEKKEIAHFSNYAPYSNTSITALIYDWPALTV